MTDPAEVGQALAALAEALDALAVPWAVGGSLASAAHGEPRATNDIDVVAVLSERQARDLVGRLGEAFYADADAAADAARRRSSFNIVDTRSFIKLDLFVPPPGPLGEGQLTRRVHLDLFPGVRAIPVLGAEDIVVQKLRWYALGGEVSDRQWRDIVSVLRIRGSDLDTGYLDTVAEAAGLVALLLRARRDAADGP
jgi:hypothetical protein